MIARGRYRIYFIYTFYIEWKREKLGVMFNLPAYFWLYFLFIIAPFFSRKGPNFFEVIVGPN